MQVSTSLLPLDKQANLVSLNFTYSAYGIMYLNESLPPYMARDFILAPFRPSTGGSAGVNGTWTARTRLYSVDMKCEVAGSNDTYYTSSDGCAVPKPYQPTGNAT